MHRYLGIHCPTGECGAFNVYKELRPIEVVPKLHALQWLVGTCPKCRRCFRVSVENMVEIESEDPASQTAAPDREA
jgi:hypothetical protein